MRPLLAAAWVLAATGQPYAAQTGEWIVDPIQSAVSFRYVEDGASKTGTFARFSADVDFDPARPQDTQAAFDVDTASIDLDDSLREGVLVTTPWFDSERFPTASFKLTDLSPAADTGAYWANGVLTIKGVKRPVRFKTTVSVTASDARARGTLEIDRTDFRLRDVVLESVVTVGASVSIAFDLVARATR